MGGRGSTPGNRAQADANAAAKRQVFMEAHRSRLARSASNLAGAANAAISDANEVRRMLREGANGNAVNTSAIERRLLRDVRAAALGTRLSVTAAGNFRDTAMKGMEGWEVGDTRFTDRQFAQYLLGANHVYYSEV